MSIQGNINQLLSIGAGIATANKLSTPKATSTVQTVQNKSYESLKAQIEENRNVMAGMSERIEMLKARTPSDTISELNKSGILSNRQAKKIEYKLKGGNSNAGTDV